MNYWLTKKNIQVLTASSLGWTCGGYQVTLSNDRSYNVFLNDGKPNAKAWAFQSSVGNNNQYITVVPQFRLPLRHHPWKNKTLVFPSEIKAEAIVARDYAQTIFKKNGWI